ncbi:MAG: SdrD B-like domain-containing protein [Rhodohalobacter sp.]|uniref:hypothetical protein n=1 Tax=Rhodohalobacter sp. TaxID=1974210 RepID=UPI0039759C9D
MFTNKKIRTSPKFDSWPTAFGLILIFALGAIIQSCSDINSSVSEEIEIESYAMPTAAVTGVNESDPVEINNFEIKFKGNTYDQDSNTSTFSYTVSRGDDGTGFNYMKFEVPSCAEFKDYSPLEASSKTNDEIEWTSSIGTNSSRDYKITYHGKVLTGMVDATIQASGSGDIETEPIPGPCKGVYTISGFIYVDENGDGNEDPGEGGIDNVELDLTETSPVSNNPITGSVLTSSDGSYTFNVYTGDSAVDFSIDIDPASNQYLFDGSFKTLTETTLPLTVTVSGADVTTESVGFVPNTQKLTSDFDQLVIKLKTESPSFWQEEFKFSTKGKGTFFPKDSLVVFLQRIDELDLTYKFDFGVSESERLSNAENILTIKKNSTDLEVLLAELLAAKLNVVSGNGAVDDFGETIGQFNTLILKTGAAAAVALDPPTTSSLMMNSTTSETTTFSTTSSSTIDDSGVLLRSFNGSGGSIGD